MWTHAYAKCVKNVAMTERYLKQSKCHLIDVKDKKRGKYCAAGLFISADLYREFAYFGARRVFYERRVERVVWQTRGYIVAQRWDAQAQSVVCTEDKGWLISHQRALSSRLRYMGHLGISVGAHPCTAHSNNDNCLTAQPICTVQAVQCTGNMLALNEQSTKSNRRHGQTIVV